MMIDRCAASIESTFFDYLSKKIHDNELCNRLAQALTNADLNGEHKVFEVSLIDGRSEFLGMCVYPDMADYNRLISEVTNAHGISQYKSNYERFCHMWFTSLRKFYIEIDKNVFDRKVINFNPQELTAMLLHELSHVVYSDRVSSKMYYAWQVHKKTLDSHDPGLSRLAISTLYIIPGMIACAANKANTGRNGMKEEYICDKVFGLKGYQEHLVTALDKIIKAYGTKFVLDDGKSDKQIDATMKWVDFNVDNVISRRDALGREIVNMASGTRSKYTKDVLLTISKKLGLTARDKYTGKLIAMESIFEDIYSGELDTNGMLTKYDIIGDAKAIGALELQAKIRPAIEHAKFGVPKLPSGLDIDTISIEIDRARTHADRIYILDLIHSKLEQVDEFEEYYSGNTYTINKYKPKIELYRKTLEEYRSMLLNKRNLNTVYKVFTKCPVGYEG